MQRLLRELSPPFLSLLETTTNVQNLCQIHAQMVVTGIINDPFAASRLLSSPALVKFDYAHSIFTCISSPNLFIWNTMIKKLIDDDMNHIDLPLSIYKQMHDAGLRPNTHTCMYLIKALSVRKQLREGEGVHSNVVKFGHGSSPFVLSALIGFYGACGFVNSGRRVFDEVFQPGLILWTAMIRVYVCMNCPKEALALFREMRVVGLRPDAVALATIVSACCQLGDLSRVMILHGFIIKSGIEIDDFVKSGLLGMYGDCGSLDYANRLFCEMPTKNVVVWNSMIHQCVKHGNLDPAHQLFKKMPGKDVVSWNTMITGLTRVGRFKEALTMFHQMELSGVKPNSLTMLSILSACSSLGALDTGTWIHAYMEKNNLNSDGSLDPGLIEMYSKCGSIDKAIQVFNKVPRKHIFSWTPIICGLAMHGHGKQAIHKFSQMQEAGVKEDDVVMVGVLNACAHAGLLDQGWKYFNSMEKVYNLTPKIEHYGCMVDLLGRIGQLREAFNLIMEMPMEPNEVIWGTLLSACRVHNDVELGEVVAKRMLELDPSDPWIRVMLSNMYAKASRWDGVMSLRKEMKARGLRKEPGCSSIEVNGRVHEFLVGDNSHPKHDEIHLMLEKIEKISKLQ